MDYIYILAAITGLALITLGLCRMCGSRSKYLRMKDYPHRDNPYPDREYDIPEIKRDEIGEQVTIRPLYRDRKKK